MSPSRISSFTTADTVDSFGFLFREIGSYFTRAKRALIVAGMIICTKYVYEYGYKSGRFIYIYFLGPSVKFEKEVGKWALIYGVTEQLGKEFAIELAERRFNLVLIGDNKDSLQSIEEQILMTTEIEILMYHTEDLNFGECEEKLKEKDFYVLVNNWGAAVGTKTSRKSFQIIRTRQSMCQCLSTWLGRHMAKKGKGVIITVAYDVADSPDNGNHDPEIYYLNSLTNLQNEELVKMGVIVQLLTPLRSILCNKEEDESKSKLLPNRRIYVNQSLEILGRSSVTSGCWSHCVFIGIHRILPRCVQSSYINYLRRLSGNK